jgi:hypothetical protein
MRSNHSENIPPTQGKCILPVRPWILAASLSLPLVYPGHFGASPAMGAPPGEDSGAPANPSESTSSDSTNPAPVPLDQLYQPPPMSKWLAERDLTIRDWHVVGSGCPVARLSAPGGTRVKLARGIKGYDVTIQVEQYELDGKKPINPRHATFARECTMLLSVYPAAGKKLSNAEADAAIFAQKSANVRAGMAARITLGGVDLSLWEKQLDKGKNSAFDERIHLSGNDKTAFENLDCEQPKLVGVAYSFVNFRDSFKDKVLIRLNGKNTRVHLDFTDCSPLESRNNAPLGGVESVIAPK